MAIQDEQTPFGELVKLWESIKIVLTPFDLDTLGDMVDQWNEYKTKHPDNANTGAHEVVSEALRITGESIDRPNLRYAQAILKNWTMNGYKPTGFEKELTGQDFIDDYEKFIAPPVVDPKWRDEVDKYGHD